MIMPDKDMKMLQSTGVLGLLNVQEPCVISGSSPAESETPLSASEVVLSKCAVPSKVTIEERKTVLNRRKTSENAPKYASSKAKIVEGQAREEIGNLKPELESLDKAVRKGERVDNKRSLSTRKDNKGSLHISVANNKGQLSTVKDRKGSYIEGLLGIRENIVALEKEKIGVLRECREPAKSSHKHDVDTSLVKNVKTDLAKDTETGCSEVIYVKEDPMEQACPENPNKSKPLPSGVESYKAKKLRLDQITGKLSIQRQTQMTAKREVIKQKLDHLKSEEIVKSAHLSPQSYHQISPDPPPYTIVSGPPPRMTPQYVERYPAPTLLTYTAPTQCTGPYCSYQPGNSYRPATSCGYRMNSGGLPPEAYVVYGPGTQPYPVLPPSIASAPCK